MSMPRTLAGVIAVVLVLGWPATPAGAVGSDGLLARMDGIMLIGEDSWVWDAQRGECAVSGAGPNLLLPPGQPASYHFEFSTLVVGALFELPLVDVGELSICGDVDPWIGNIGSFLCGFSRAHGGRGKLTFPTAPKHEYQIENFGWLPQAGDTAVLVGNIHRIDAGTKDPISPEMILIGLAYMHPIFLTGSPTCQIQLSASFVASEALP
jgi:hypothetical protein